MENPDRRPPDLPVPSPPRSVLDCHHLFVPGYYRDRGKNRVLFCAKCHAIYEFSPGGRRLRYLGLKPSSAHSSRLGQPPKPGDPPRE